MPKLPADPPRWLSEFYGDAEGKLIIMLGAHCPACDFEHSFRIGAEYWDREGLAVWEFNGDYERPTFTGSMLSRGGKRRCHSYLENGQWRFLADCTHALAGQTVPMVRIKNWGDPTGGDDC